LQLLTKKLIITPKNRLGFTYMLIFSKQKGLASFFAPLFILLTLLLSGCASNEVVTAEAEDLEVEVEVSEIDPYEGFNRKVFVFNDTLDTYVAAPISDAYLWVAPEFVQSGITNFFSNLKDINVVLNDMMQGKLAQGAEDSGRFAVNSTIGLLGLFDVATELGLEKHDEDFAQTLAVWGVPQGPYLVLPLLGPATTRGVPGGIFDAAANPATYVGAPIQLLQMLNARANADGELNFIEEAALDPYVFTRESFLQYRKNLITDGESANTDDLLDFEDEFDDEEGIDDTASIKAIEPVDAVEVEAELESADAKIVETDVEESAVNSKDFSKASGSFDGAVKSFDDAANSFKIASDKLNQLEAQ